MQTDVQNGPGKPRVAEIASATDIFYVKLGEEMFKRNIQFLNEVLRQLLTLSVGLLGGGMVFLNDGICNSDIKFAASGLFAIAMLFAFFGVLPYREDVCLNMPEDIRQSVVRAVWWKDMFIYGASIFIVLGLGLAFVGVMIGRSP